ncbi:hypothetical protein [Roseomonas xinghualingensis]|uniref:hypothetical protein n=1 Tax=Roseomonas xinghualingensis TaxID=2986475 RepID=UPI0021F133FE|nr:hypothetical protein [Roseomonas sp. SXEYE001]MCV4207549.1 hypothetical protein [Roseomonas sp. SXEYE001]
MSGAAPKLGVTVADVVRALIAKAPDDVSAKRWLAELLPGLDVAAELRPGVAHPFGSEEELGEARQMVAEGKDGRAIAEWFGLRVGPVAEWLAAERSAPHQLQKDGAP